MDLSLIAIAQQVPENQFTYDQKAMDRAVSLQEERRLFLVALWSQCLARIRLNSTFGRLVTRIVAFRQSLTGAVNS